MHASRKKMWQPSCKVSPYVNLGDCREIYKQRPHTELGDKGRKERRDDSLGPSETAGGCSQTIVVRKGASGGLRRFGSMSDGPVSVRSLVVENKYAPHHGVKTRWGALAKHCITLGRRAGRATAANARAEKLITCGHLVRGCRWGAAR